MEFRFWPQKWQKKSRQQSIAARVDPNWYLVWGKILSRPQGCSFFCADRYAIANFSPIQTDRLVLVGDIWLSNKKSLINLLPTIPTAEITDLHLVAILWEKLGTETVKYLEGIFAIAVWDKEQSLLWLVRDPVGGKTLYYTRSGSYAAIAPRLKTLFPFHSQELDPIAIRDYLCCAFVPGQRTLYQEVKELRPGTILQFPGQTIHQYWQPEKLMPGESLGLEEYAKQLRSLLNGIIGEYLPSNEPVGVYLSGGLDSSCITALAATFHNYPVHTYSIHFGKECPNELEFSSAVARQYHTEHHILEITPEQMWNLLPVTMSHLDDPIGDPLTVPNYLLGQRAMQDTKVILNGEGGDPCFGGPKNQPMLLELLYKNSSDRELISAYLNSFQKLASDLPQLLKPRVSEAIKTASWVFAEDLCANAPYLTRLMLINTKYKGADHILTKVNNLTSAAGLSGRSPLFDRTIVEFAFATPPEYKLAGAIEKAVLKEAVLDLLPLEIVKRPKSGMMVPVQRWFRQYWQRPTKSLLLNKNAAIAPYFDRNLIKQWIDYRGDTWMRYGVKLWLLVSLEIWLQVNRK